MAVAGTTIHVLGAGDVAKLRALLGLFGRAFDDMEHCDAAQPDDAYLARQLACEGVVVLAACLAGDVVGGLVGYVLPQLSQPRSELYLYDLAVAETHRRQGVATALIAALRELAVRRRIDVVYVQAHRGDAPAVALYTRLGTGTDVLHFELLPGPGGR